MRIAVLIGTSSRQSGGSHTYSSLLLEGILQSELKEKAEFVFFLGNRKVNPSEILFQARNPESLLRRNPLKPFSLKLLSALTKFAEESSILVFLNRFIRAKRLNRQLRKHQIEFVWSLFPLSIALDIPYAMPVWDLQHRLQPFWPEVSKSGQWCLRETGFRNSIRRATFVIVGTNVGAKEVSELYGCASEKFIIASFPIKPLQNALKKRDPNLVFYPAQFWPHKNHVNLILGLKQFLSMGNKDLRLVLPGSDKGNLRFIQNLVKVCEMENNVVFPGFVSDLELKKLYETASLMIFPSYFGPDNIPPLEALTYACPVAVAEVSGAREQFGASVDYFDPDSPSQIASAIEIGIKESQAKQFALKSRVLDFPQKSPSSVATEIIQEILKFQPKRRNWK